MVTDSKQHTPNEVLIETHELNQVYWYQGVFRRSGINDNNESLNLFEIICVI